MPTRVTNITVIAILLCQPLHAEESAPQPQLEQTLVSASRTPISAEDLALAWSVIDSESLNLVNHVHINEIMQHVSGAWISRGNGQESLSALRSPVLTGAGGCGAILAASDGISLRAPGFCNVNQLFDANAEQAGSIEVIKGPATALYGSNAMHGVINIISAAPPTQTDSRIAFEAGPYDYYRAKYRYGGTSGEHGIAIRANASTDGGYKDDSGYDQQKISLRHDYRSEKWTVTSVLNAANLNQETAGFVQGEEAYKDNALKRSNPNPEAYRDARSLMLYSRIDYTLNDHNVLSVTPYLRDNEMEFLQHFLPWQSTERNGHSSVGVRAFSTTSTENMQWVNGLDVEYTDGWLEETQDQAFSPNQPVGTHYDYEVIATLAAAYSQLTADINSRWSFTAGVRYEHTQYEYENRIADGSACSPQATNCRFFRPEDRNDNFGDWSVNAGTSFQTWDQQYLYLRAAHGFRAPQTTELYRLQAGQSVADLDSENMDSIEIGLRGSLTDALSYDVSAYSMHKDNVIFQDSNRQNVSGAKTRHAGIDIALDYQLAVNWRLRLDATYAQHKYDSTIELIGSSGEIDGNYIDTAPKVFGSAGLSWNMSSATGVPGVAELEWIYMDSYYLEPDNEHQYDGHSLLNLRVTTQLSKRLSAGLRLTNLLDEDYAERADFGFGNYRYFVGQPVGAFFELAYQFGQ